MIYGLYSNMDNNATRAIFREKRIPEQNYIPVSNLPHLAQGLVTDDKVYVMDINRFASMEQLLAFAGLCHDRGVSLGVIEQPYLDIGKSKRWKPSIIRLVRGMIASEGRVKAEMRHGFKLSNAQYAYWDYCFERMNLFALSLVFSPDGVLGRGR